MESRYYTPDLSDLFVGYECERIIHDFSQHIDIFLPEGATQEEYDKVWDEYYTSVREFHSGPIKSESYVLTGKDLLRAEPCNNIRGFIRTPYLTKEQVEAEGWERQNNLFNEFQRLGTMPDYVLKTSSGSLNLFIKNLNNPSENICISEYIRRDGPFELSSFNKVYDGKCPSINEFRKICKLLSI